MKPASARTTDKKALTDVESLQRLATVVRDSNDAIILFDLSGRILAWNRGAVLIYGYSEAEALGMNILELVPGSERESNEAMMKKLQAGERISSFETKRITKGGRVLDVWLTITSLKDKRGEPYVIATTERDITEIKRNVESLQKNVESLQRLATVVRDSNDAIILFDLSGRILAWNRGATQIYGYSEAEALSMNILDLVPESMRGSNRAMMEKLRTGKPITSFETKRMKKDGALLDVWFTITALKDEHGEPYAIATTERDLTRSLQKLVDKLQRRTEELETTTEALEVSNEEAKSMNDQLDVSLEKLQNLNSELVAYGDTIFKIFRGPLDQIDAAVRSLRETPVSGLSLERQRDLAKVEESGARIADDIAKFDTLLRVKGGSVNRERVDISAMAADIFQELKSKDPGAKVRVHLPPSISVIVDREMMHQALYYLFRNSWNCVHDQEFSMIVFTMHMEPPSVVFSVRDNRSGCDPRSVECSLDLQKIAECDQPAPEIDLGLTIAKAIIERHDGKMWVKYEKGKWLKFYFKLEPTNRVN